MTGISSSSLVKQIPSRKLPTNNHWLHHRTCLFGVVFVCFLIGFSAIAPSLNSKQMMREPMYMDMTYIHEATRYYYISRDNQQVCSTTELSESSFPVTDESRVYSEDYRQPHNISNIERQLNVYYLKVHKTGSSTFRNILQRLILNHNLSTPIFRQQHTYPSRNMLHKLVPIKTIFDKRKQLASTEEAIRQNQCNIICVHTVFNKTQINTIMPKDTLLVASIREPFSQFKSSFNFWKLSEKYQIKKSTDPILEYFRNLDKYEKLLPGSFYNPIAKKENVLLSYSKNYMAYEYGFDLDRIHNETYVNGHLEFINSTFKSVMILEKYDESLLLLRKNTHWTFEELLYVKQRDRKYSFKAKNYTSDIVEMHRGMSPIDYRIYDMFLERHNKLVHFAGSRFQDELKAFRSVLEKMHDFCLPLLNKIQRTKKLHQIIDIAERDIVINATEFSDSFTLSGAKCALLSMGELFLRTAVKLWQYPSICQTKSTWKYAGLSQKRFSAFCGSAKKMIFNISYDFYKVQGVW